MENQPREFLEENQRGLINENNPEDQLGLTIHKDDITRMIQSAPPIAPVIEKSAPFADYAENTDKSWKLVKPEDVKEYLESKLFFKTSSIPSSSLQKVGEVYIRYSEEAIKVPLDLIVNAAGFESWLGRSKKYNKKFHIQSGGKGLSGEMKSLDVAKLYAGTPTPLPPVDIMTMYIQPNQKIFFDNGSGDSHRIAAAILRGDKDIETRCVYVYKLDTDYF